MRRSLATFTLSLSVLAFGCSSSNGGHSDGGPVVIPPDMAVGTGGVGSGSPDLATAAPKDMTPLPPPDLYGLPAPDHDPTLHPPLPVLSKSNSTSQFVAPVVWTVVWKDPAATTAPYGNYGADVQTFTTWLLSSDYWKTSTSEYGVGAGTAGGVLTIAAAPPANISDSALQTLIKNNLGKNGWPTASSNLIISFVTDPTTTSTLQSGLFTTAKSCVDFDGYHQKTSAGVAYLVNAYCLKADGVTPDWDNLTVTISHEAAEAVTDSDLASNRVLIPGTNSPYAGGGETGDMCLAVNARIAAGSTSYLVQQIYSNATVTADNAAPMGFNSNPCLPNSDGPYFGAGFWSGDTSNGGFNQSVLKVKLASNGTGSGTFNIEPFAYDSSVGPIEFFVAGSLLPAGVTLDPDLAIRADPANPNGPPLGVRMWGNPGSTTAVKVNFGSTYQQDGQPVQVLVVAETQGKRLNVWWASVQPQ